jgi:hypothetical protein
MQIVAYNSRERIVELFRECYDDRRDVKKVLDMITGRAAYIKLVGQTLMVVPDALLAARLPQCALMGPHGHVDLSESFSHRGVLERQRFT